jgi:hypothetical protein
MVSELTAITNRFGTSHDFTVTVIVWCFDVLLNELFEAVFVTKRESRRLISSTLDIKVYDFCKRTFTTKPLEKTIAEIVIFCIRRKRHLTQLLTELRFSYSLTARTDCSANLTVPENSTGSWGMMDIFERNNCKGTCVIFTPSINISPSDIWTALNRLIVNDDLPLPVRPQIPICNT